MSPHTPPVVLCDITHDLHPPSQEEGFVAILPMGIKGGAADKAQAAALGEDDA
ncbi:hypothetical protein B0H13DRAFT_2324975 [Mycena leptocephala]|nr:hypothetical protein B0H13DRAFT_2324975 [Mycena leptocephala]